ncbi:aldehyde dehydrogenase (NADP(+)) [Filimonas effusa]|uniref:Aldehyde dehydrogenase (NADP(+)) n=2 Tax=Filimonas effusa TaxID=2508721 RepID=A0A4Q1DEM0_9BACT|nr:aldehyde dehydrogenase (NADP(+)) [Filimonas effusa]
MNEEMTAVDSVMKQAQQAYDVYGALSGAEKAAFLDAIAAAIEARREALVTIAGKETNLPPARLNGELSRTTGQLKLFGQLLREGSWVEAAIDTANATRTPARPDIRKMLVPLGPVVVFGASNFPFAFSTAGGDTASALAAGCPVILKAHSAHAATSAMVFEAITEAIETTGVPEFTVQHVMGRGNTVGKALVQHPLTTAVGFTGSFSGGKALCNYSNEREKPVPVFAEMSSINPVVFFPDTLEKNTAELAKQYAASITLGMGQFCTNPGLLLAIESDALEQFIHLLGAEIAAVAPQKMLHKGICESYNELREGMLTQQGLEVVATAAQDAHDMEALPTLARVKAADFLANPHFSEEVFGPFSLVITCQSREQLKQVLAKLKGQLTTTVMATPADLAEYKDVIKLQQSLAGRIMINNVPTGVEVCAAMVHGGPYPATTDARFTSVGLSSIQRWVRPLCFQNFPDELLPDELKQDNPLSIWRLVDNEWKQ